MRTLVLGADGYIGWPLCMHLSNAGHRVCAVDSFLKRGIEAEVSVKPLNSPALLQERVSFWNQRSGKEAIECIVGNIATNNRFLYHVIRDFKPDSIVHLAEQPSAPYSMKGRSEAVDTQVNNVVGTLNLIHAVKAYDSNIHIVKLGTMGEYGQPNIDIEEGWIDIQHNGRSDRLLYPKSPGSFYHASKVHDSTNLEFACRNWGLRVTDLNQGVVYGTHTANSIIDERLCTSFHYDDVFGTVINRFMTQAVSKKPMTVYGDGSQIRAYIHIDDVMKCIELALRNPANGGEFRVFNQFTTMHSINELSSIVASACKSINIETSVENLQNPRVEKYNHYFNAKATRLIDLGLKPTYLNKDAVIPMLKYIMRFSESVNKEYFKPRIAWDKNSQA